MSLAAMAAVYTSAATAQGTPSGPALTGGQVLLQLQASDSVTTPADLAVWRVQFVCKGNTIAEAQQASAARLEEMTSALRAAGGDAVIVQPFSAMGPFGFVGNEQYAAEVGPDAAAVMAGAQTNPAQPQQKSVITQYEVTLRDLSKTAQIRAAIEAFAGGSSEPVYRLADPDKARRNAAVHALAKARLDAEAYAAASKMQLGPMTRISNAGPTGMERLSQEFQSRMFGRAEAPGTVTTSETIYVDFVLKPN